MVNMLIKELLPGDALVFALKNLDEVNELDAVLDVGFLIDAIDVVFHCLE